MQLLSTNPSENYTKIGEVTVSTSEQVKAAVAAAHAAKKAWRDLGVDGRVALLRKVGKRFEDNTERIVQLTAQEMGMSRKEALSDVAGCLEYWNAYLDSAAELLKLVITFENEKEVHEMRRMPRGVAVCIVPWNFPLANFVWQCGQNLVAGNTVVFKHSEEVPLFGKLLEEIVNAELPEGVFNEVYGSADIGKMLVEENVDFICLTGSAAAGRMVSAAAGARLIPVSMELGGSAPGIVLDDANVADVAETIFAARFMNNGQMCDGLKRLLVHASKFDEVVAALSAIAKTKKVGLASDEDIDFGPLVAKRQLDLLEGQVADALSKGAKVICGGKRPIGLQGAYYEPTLLVNTTPDMRVWQEEVFGPVLPIVTFETDEEAIRMANDTQYGLGGYIFTVDSQRFTRIAKELETCMVGQNNLSYIRPENFFGGCKQSGSGREHGPEGFHDVTMSKVITREK